MKHFPVSNFLILNQFTIIYNYFLIVFDQTKTTLSIFFNNWVTRRKRNIFCKKSSVLVYGVEYCIKIYLYLYNLHCTNMTYCGIGKRLWSLVPKWSNDQWLFCLYKSQSCRQHNMTSLCGPWHIGSSSLWMPSCESGMMQREYIQCSNNKTLKQTELIRIKLMLVFETRNYLNIS